MALWKTIFYFFGICAVFGFYRYFVSHKSHYQQVISTKIFFAVNSHPKVHNKFLKTKTNKIISLCNVFGEGIILVKMGQTALNYQVLWD